VGQVVKADLLLFNPLAVGLAGGQRALDLVVGDDALLSGIAEQHAAGLEAPFIDHILRLDGEHAGLRGHDQQVVGGDEVAGRAQAVAIERGADNAAVGEGDGGGAVQGSMSEAWYS